MKGFRKLGEPLFQRGLTSRLRLGTRMAGGDSTAPTFTIRALSAASNVVSMQITASEQVTGFVVGDITITAGGSLAGFATADNITFTLSWTLAAGANTMDIPAGVCTDLAGNANLAATQYNAGFLTLQPDSTADIDTFINANVPNNNYVGLTGFWLGFNANVRRGLINFDLSSVPANATISSAVFTLYMEFEASASARRVSIYRLLTSFVLAQCTWNVKSTGVNWQTAGASGVNDREQVEWAGRNFTSTEAAGAKTFTLPVTTKTDFGAYGWLFQLSDETVDAYFFDLCNHATGAQRPKLVIVYYVNP